ncbi:uncharacterized protein [Littorina saxatilis]|uniref:uncharacterized protein n=1 Tax=Littorina saxatilis TaxID=31220 RepID=UPI0038B42263
MRSWKTNFKHKGMGHNISSASSVDNFPVETYSRVLVTAQASFPQWNHVCARGRGCCKEYGFSQDQLYNFPNTITLRRIASSGLPCATCLLIKVKTSLTACQTRRDVIF